MHSRADKVNLISGSQVSVEKPAGAKVWQTMENIIGSTVDLIWLFCTLFSFYQPNIKWLQGKLGSGEFEQTGD